MQTGTEVEFMEEVCGQIKQEIYRAALSNYEKIGTRKILTEHKIADQIVDSCGPDEHHAMEKDYVLLPESEELSDEQSDDDYLFEDFSDTEFSDVELDVNDARSFAASFNSSASDNVTAKASNFGVGVKGSRNDLLGAWGLMELKTGVVNQKLCNETYVADETQLYD